MRAFDYLSFVVTLFTHYALLNVFADYIYGFLNSILYKSMMAKE